MYIRCVHFLPQCVCMPSVEMLIALLVTDESLVQWKVTNTVQTYNSGPNPYPHIC